MLQWSDGVVWALKGLVLAVFAGIWAGIAFEISRAMWEERHNGR